jgi:hypothetical protein
MKSNVSIFVRLWLCRFARHGLGGLPSAAHGPLTHHPRKNSQRWNGSDSRGIDTQVAGASVMAAEAAG